MNENEEQSSWEGDVCRDTVTYRFIELSVAALTTAFEQDDELREKYSFWLSEKNEETKPIVLYDFALENDDTVDIFAMPNENEFFIRFKSSSFEVSVLIVYEIERMDVCAGRIVMFTGNAAYAVSWAEALHAAWDDLLFDLMRTKGDDV